MDLDSLEKAIEVLTNPISGVSTDVKKEANDFLLSFIENNYMSYKSFYFSKDQPIQVKYWLIQALCDIALKYWDRLDHANQVELWQSSIEFIKLNKDLVIPIDYLCSKYCVYIALLIKQSYPHIWKDIIQNLIELAEYDADMLKFTFIVFEQINDEIIDRDNHQSNEDNLIAGRVKDAMRERDVLLIVDLCKKVLDNYEQLDQKIVNMAIDTIADLIEWNDVAIFAPFLEIMDKMIDIKDYQQNALYCIYTFAHKGMDSDKKISLIKEIDIINRIRSFNIDPDDSELWQSVSDIISKLGLLVLEVIQTSAPGDTCLQPAQALLLDLLVLNILFLECDDIKSACYIARFLNESVLYLKRLDTLDGTLIEILTKIHDLTVSKLQYPDWWSMEDTKLGEDEENYRELRHGLATLYSNTMQISQMKEHALQTLQRKVSELDVAAASYSEVELPLFLLAHMHAAITREDKDFSNPVYQALLNEFMTKNFVVSKSSLVTVQYFEIWVKYASYFIRNPQLVPPILDNLLSEKGVLHSSGRVASRSSFLALRFIDRLKNQLADSAELIFERAKSIIEISESGQSHLLPNDIENFYEMVGSAMANFNMDPSNVRDTLEKYFGFLCEKIYSFDSAATESIVEGVRRLDSSVKQLNAKSCLQSLDLFSTVWEKLYPILSQNIKYTSLRDAVIVFLQKSMNLYFLCNSTELNKAATGDESSKRSNWDEILSIIDKYLELIFGIETVDWFEAGLRLATYVSIEAGEQGLPTIDKYIPLIISNADKIGFPDTGVSDDDRDKLNVFAKLLRLLTQSVQRNWWLLLAPHTLPVFENIINLLVFMVKQGVDKHLRKEALLIIRTVLTEFSGCTLAQIKQAHPGDKGKIEERKIWDRTEYEGVWRHFVEVVSREMFEVFGYMNPADPIDMNWIYYISLIHVILLNYDSSFAAQYESSIKSIKPDIAFEDLAKTIQMFVEDKLKTSMFKLNITKLFRSN